MADDLKKVGLVFTADGATDFKNSITAVNASLAENRSEFKLVKSQWDENTTASEKLIATNEYLTKMYEDSADKVALYTKELEELESAEIKDEVAISKKQSALNSATSSMNYYKAGVEETSTKIKAGTADLEEYASKLTSMGDKATEVGKTLSTTLTAGVVAVGTAALVAWNEIDEAYDSIVSGTGATGDALDELTESFDTVYGNFPASASEVATAIADVNTRLEFTGEELEDASTAFLQFAEVNNVDVATAVETVSRAMGDAGVESSEYSSVLDSLTAASQASGASIDELAEYITNYGAPMRALGFEMEESIALFAQWEKAGVNVETAFSGMKTAISGWSAEGLDAREEFEKTLDAIESAPDIATATSLAIDAFGSKAGADLADAIQGGKFSVEELMEVIEDSEGIVTDAFEEMQDPTDDATVAFNNLKLVGADLGNTIMTSLGPIITWLSEKIVELKDWFGGLSDGMKTNIVIIAAIVAAIGPLLVVFGTIASAIGSLISLYSTVAVAIAALNAPILAIIAAIGLFVGAFVWLMATSEEFRQNVFDVFDNVVGIFSGVIDFITGVFTGDWEKAWSGVASVFKNTFSGIVNVVKLVINGVIGLVNGMIGAVESGINFIIAGLNKIEFEVPDWVPLIGGTTFGINLGYASFPNVPYLAKGGDLLSGMAIVGEAGPELLTQSGNRTSVSPLSTGGGANPIEIVDYEKMAEAFVKALKYLKVELDGDEVGQFVDERLLKVLL